MKLNEEMKKSIMDEATKKFGSELPDEMLDAGRIDGLNEWGLFWKMVFTK